MSDITDEMVNQAMRAYQDAPYTGAGSWPGIRAAIAAVAPLIAAQERERCAAVADGFDSDTQGFVVAAAIRALAHPVSEPGEQAND